MQELIEALILGIVQGLTEFLPVSSSGHLEIMKVMLDDDSVADQSMLTTVILHFATALATVWVFRNDIVKIVKGLFQDDPANSNRKFATFIIISMIPAVFVGLFFEETIELLFHRNLVLVGSMLLVTGLLLLLSERLKVKASSIGPLSAFIIGISQAIAILPGISRSGSTIATSLLLGINKTEAARFSFLMVVPLIFGKMAKDALSGDLIEHMPSASYLIIGFCAAFVSGYLACKFMLKIVQKSKLSWFALYCFIVGLSLLIYCFY